MIFTSKRSVIESPKILLNLLVMTMINRDTIEKYTCRTVTVLMKVWSREESSNLGSAPPPKSAEPKMRGPLLENGFGEGSKLLETVLRTHH